MSRKLCIELWNKSLPHKVLSYKKEFNKLVGNKYRQFRHKMLKQIVDSNENSPNEFWRNIKKLKKENHTKILALIFSLKNGLILKNVVILMRF